MEQEFIFCTGPDFAGYFAEPIPQEVLVQIVPVDPELETSL
jgi:hypothetical protein